MTYKLNRDYKGYKKGQTVTDKYHADLDNDIHPDELKLLLDAGYLTPILDLPEDVKEDIKTVLDSTVISSVILINEYDSIKAAIYRLRTLIGE